MSEKNKLARQYAEATSFVPLTDVENIDAVIQNMRFMAYSAGWSDCEAYQEKQRVDHDVQTISKLELQGLRRAASQLQKLLKEKEQEV